LGWFLCQRIQKSQPAGVYLASCCAFQIGLAEKGGAPGCCPHGDGADALGGMSIGESQPQQPARQPVISRRGEAGAQPDKRLRSAFEHRFISPEKCLCDGVGALVQGCGATARPKDRVRLCQ